MSHTIRTLIGFLGRYATTENGFGEAGITTHLCKSTALEITMHIEKFACTWHDEREAPPSAAASSNSTVRVTIRPTSLGNRGQVYSVFLDGQLLIERTLDPTPETCRLLSSRGQAGRLEVWDEERPYPRLIVHDLVKAAGLTVSETERHGPRFRRYKPFPELGREA